MTWLFAILVVLVMGAIAVVAAGRGEPLAPECDDRPDVTVPAVGPVGADELRRVRFSLALRGYRMSEVDALLDRLASQLEAVGRDHGTDAAGCVGENRPDDADESRGQGPTG